MWSWPTVILLLAHLSVAAGLPLVRNRSLHRRDDEGEDRLGGEEIAGIVVGSIAGFLLLVGVPTFVVLGYMRNKKKAADRNQQADAPVAAQPSKRANLDGHITVDMEATKKLYQDHHRNSISEDDLNQASVVDGRHPMNDIKDDKNGYEVKT
jgi:hypothetical protein